jgi:hypothetical protein
MSEASGEDEPTGSGEVDLDQFVGEPPAGDARRDEFMSDDQSARGNRGGREDQAAREDRTDEPTDAGEDDQ